MTEKLLPITTNPRAIIAEVGTWAIAQPWGESSGQPKHAPDYGVVEEVGELFHAILKRIQGIRGMDVPEAFREKSIDALGDAMVYLSHWCYLKDCYYTLSTKACNPPDDFRVLAVQLFNWVSRLFSMSHGYGSGADVSLCTSVATGIAQSLQMMASYLGYDLLNDCLVPTWNKVKQRNWNKDKLHGGEQPSTVS